MLDYDFDVGILGGEAAGLTVAAGAAQLGAKTLLVEKEEVLGGDCLYYGCVPSKTLIRTAHVYHLMNNAASFGLPQNGCNGNRYPAERPNIEQGGQGNGRCRLSPS